MTNESFIRIKELSKMLGISRSSIYRLVKDGKFPRQIKLTERTCVWKMSAVNQWISEKEKVGKNL